MEMRIKGVLLQQMDANLRMLTSLQDRLRSNVASASDLEDRKAYLEAQRYYGEYYTAPGGK